MATGALAVTPSRLATVVLIGLASVAHAAHAGRLPAPGGEVRVALPLPGDAAFREAHTGVAVIEPAASDPRERLARPGLAGTDHRSRVLTAVEVVSPTSWRLTAAEGVSSVGLAKAIEDCLTASTAWPGRLLSAAGRTPTIRRDEREIAVDFPATVGPIFALLQGCVVVGPAIPGSFRAHPREDGLLTATAVGPGGGPLLDSVRVSGPDEDADVAVNTRIAGATGDELQAPTPDVVLLLQGEEARRADPLDLADDPGLARFVRNLKPELLTAVFWGGRGGRAPGVLPPGLGPTRPLPRRKAPADDEPLTMRTLANDAPRVAVAASSGPLEQATQERLIALLRARGVRSDPKANVALQLIRWRPQTLDPALALLQLVADYPDVFSAPTDLLDALLSGDPAERLAAAVSVEASWLSDRRVVPLFTAERWISVSPTVRGVRVRPDGVPLLHDAYLVGPR